LLNEKDMLIEVISKIVNERIEKAFSSFAAFFKRKYNQHKIKTGKAFKEYIKLSIEKYKYTKTIFYKYEPVLIEDFYVDLDLELNNKTIKTQRIENLIEINNDLIITGVAGSGKSTLMKYLFLNSIKNEVGIPIFIEIRNIKKDIFNDLFEILKEYDFPQDIDLFEKILKSGKFIVFLDGIDEVSPDIRNKISREIIYMRDSFSNNVYIVTSRPNEKYVSWGNFTELKILPLNKEKAKLLIKKLDYENSIKEKFLNNFDNIFKNHQSFASNPLLLTFMLMTYAEYSVIPTKVSLLYEQIFEMLYNRHDATKFDYSRKHYSNLSQYEFKKIISCFSLQSYFDKKTRFTQEEINGYLRRAKKILKIEFNEDEYLKDLLQSVSLLIQEGFYYTFIHRTFQEYFTAFFIMNADSNTRKLLLDIVFNRVTYERTLDLAFEINKNIFENDFLIPLLHKIKENTKYDKLNNNEESFRIFVENSDFEYWIIAAYPKRVTGSYVSTGITGLYDLVRRIYPKIYLKSNDPVICYKYYKEKYLTSNLDYYKNYLKKREKKGILLYNEKIINKEQLLSREKFGLFNLNDLIFFTIQELKKNIKLYHFCFANIDCSYNEYLHLMYLMKKITNG